MLPGLLRLVVLGTAVFPVSAIAAEQGFFGGLDASVGAAFGSSRTTNGGAPFAGGGVVDNVKFGAAWGGGAHAGYQFDPALSAFISYQSLWSDVRWNANYPLIGASSKFDGRAISNVILGNVAYEFLLSDMTTLKTTAGLGLSVNTLSNVVETNRPDGVFLADVLDHTKVAPAAQLGLGLWHKIAPNTVVGLDGSVAYTGGFETGNTRSGNLGVTGINPYKIDDVWRTSVSASIKASF